MENDFLKKDYLNAADKSRHWKNRQSPTEEYYNLLKNVAGDQEGKSLLDVGCAEGTEVFEFSKLGLKAQGVDAKKEFLKKAKEKFPEFNFVQGDAENLPYGDGQFEIVFSINTLFYTDIEKSIPEFLRVMKEGGYGLISFDTEIFDLDKNKIFHQESLSHLENILNKNGGKIIYHGLEEKRIDEKPFRHQHTCHKIVFQKISS